MVGTGGNLEFAQGYIEGGERVLPRGLNLGRVGGDRGLDPRERGQTHQDQHQEGHEHDRDDQGEAIAAGGGTDGDGGEGLDKHDKRDADSRVGGGDRRAPKRETGTRVKGPRAVSSRSNVFQYGG